jgi:uncharacterized protein (DUF1778 family)
MPTRASTSLRLGAKERQLIAHAAAALGDDVGAFIRDAARARAEQVLADADYRQFLAQKAKAAADQRKVAPSITDAELRRRLARRRRAG